MHTADFYTTINKTACNGNHANCILNLGHEQQQRFVGST